MKFLPIELIIDIIRTVPIEKYIKNRKILLICHLFSARFIGILLLTKAKQKVEDVAAKFNKKIFKPNKLIEVLNGRSNAELKSLDENIGRAKRIKLAPRIRRSGDEFLEKFNTAKDFMTIVCEFPLNVFTDDFLTKHYWQERLEDAKQILNADESEANKAKMIKFLEVNRAYFLDV